ncbi:MAG: stage V sporulation protein AD [Clostridia bacterium]|nr:stage V sporulation protein AD [Clostridia bacterium]
MTKKLGLQTIEFKDTVSILSTAAIAGHREGMGPLAKYYDKILEDAQWGEDTWEKTESKMQKTAISRAVEKAQIDVKDIDYIFAGDLLNQCTSSTFAFRDFGIPFLGLYGACSTMAETLGLAASMIDGGFANLCAAVTSSHFCTAERQYRFPLEYGGQRTPTAQWTVTGSGGVILGKGDNLPCITHFTVGKIVDAGIKDANNMGAAMAPAAAETILTHFEDTNRVPQDYDLILTGDLGKIGKSILIDLLGQKGYDMSDNYNDCGCMVFDINDSDIHGGGSGCGCGAITLCGYIMDMFRANEINHVLFVGTGALLSPTSTMQGESIPCVAHAVAISAK